MWDIIKNALSYFSSENDKPKSKRSPIKLTPLNLKEYAKKENERLATKQDATAFRSPTKPVSNSPANVAAALMAQRNNTKAQQEGEAKDKAKAEKEKYYNPEVLDIKISDPKLDLLYKNQWLMDVPVLGDYIKGKAKEVAQLSQGAPFVQMNDLQKNKNSKDFFPYRGSYSDINPNMPTLIDQYFSKKPLYQSSKYKPTSDYLTFLPSYSVKGKADEFLKTDQNTIRRQLDEITGQQGMSEKAYEEFLKNKKPIYQNVWNGTSYLAALNGLDLGGHKVGLAWDKEKNLPYLSLSDAWDFEPSSYSKKWSGDEASDAYVQASLLHKAGNPFKVYDRFYFDPKTKKYISDAEVDKIKKSKINTDKPLPVDRDAIAKRLGLAPKNNE
jgi:hypothetical protein